MFDIQQSTHYELSCYHEAQNYINVHTIQSIPTLFRVDTMEELVISHDVKLIIVDSVAALARSVSQKEYVILHLCRNLIQGTLSKGPST